MQTCFLCIAIPAKKPTTLLIVSKSSDKVLMLSPSFLKSPVSSKGTAVINYNNNQCQDNLHAERKSININKNQNHEKLYHLSAACFIAMLYLLYFNHIGLFL